jgi:MoaA/NifB/PqqE/SkfB family radical SAM enzyme
MAGAMAGSAVLNALCKSDVLEIVTLTINNACNLRCPHCYLQYGVTNGELINWANVHHVLESPFRHLCIVGKEPLANRRAAALTARLVAATVDTGRSCSLITNGLNLRLLDACTFKQLSWMDVSTDGGPDSYAAYRGGNYAKLVEGINHARASGLRSLRILHTVSSGNLDATAETLKAALSFEPQYVIVSPFQATRHDGIQNVSMVSPSDILHALESTGAGRDGRVWFALDSGYIRHFNDNEAVRRAIELFGERLIYVDSDPIDRGIIRVTYDGLVLSPFESVNTADYDVVGRPLRERSLSDWYQGIRAGISCH